MIRHAYAIIAILILLLAAILAGLLYGKHEYRAGYKAAEVAHAAASKEALEKRLQENATIATHYAQQAQKANLDHAQELEAVRAAARSTAAQRVPVSADFCRSLAGAPESAEAGSDGQADSGTTYLPDAFAGDLRQLAADADETLADLRHLVRRVEEGGCFE